MTTQEKEEMERLCKLIQIERDQKKFTELIVELNRLLANKEDRLTSPRNVINSSHLKTPL